MKNYVLLLAILVIGIHQSNAQMTLAHSYSGDWSTEIAQVHLSRSGTKIMTMRDQNSSYEGADTMFFYNMDYSFWKMIPCPKLLGRAGQFNFYPEMGQAISVFYPSEALFNTDTFLEVAVAYRDSLSGPSRIYIINENGAITDSIPNLSMGSVSGFRVKADTSGVFRAYVSTLSGPRVYNLPGTLPCELCSYPSLSIVKHEHKDPLFSQPVPNPSKDNVKITFTLPDDAERAELTVYSTDGRLIKTYQVDNKFGFILLDNSALAPGLYFYDIKVDGEVRSSQKFVVIK